MVTSGKKKPKDWRRAIWKFIASVIAALIVGGGGWGLYVNYENRSTNSGNCNNSNSGTNNGTQNFNCPTVNNYKESLHEWQSLSDTQIRDLENQLSKIVARKPLLIRCEAQTTGCQDFASSLAVAFSEVQWPPHIPGYISVDTSGWGAEHDGITVDKGDNADSLKQAIESSTSLKVKIDNEGFPDSVAIQIGPKE